MRRTLKVTVLGLSLAAAYATGAMQNNAVHAQCNDVAPGVIGFTSGNASCFVNTGSGGISCIRN